MEGTVDDPLSAVSPRSLPRQQLTTDLGGKWSESAPKQPSPKANYPNPIAFVGPDL